MSKRTKLSLVAALLAVTACSDNGPPTVRYGQESCAHCRMIVNDDRYAAALVATNGDVLKFDEVCCLCDYLDANPAAVKATWVRGYRSGQWHDARQAVYVHGPKLQTPMGSGLAAVATEDEANVLAKELDGKVLRFEQLSAFLKQLPGGSPEGKLRNGN